MTIYSAQMIHQQMATQMAQKQTLPSTEVDENRQAFSQLFTEQLAQTNQLQNKADHELQQFMVGESQNLHDVMIAMEEAKIALELTTQVRNKVVDAYSEIKNMQI